MLKSIVKKLKLGFFSLFMCFSLVKMKSSSESFNFFYMTVWVLLSTRCIVEVLGVLININYFVDAWLGCSIQKLYMEKRSKAEHGKKTL